MNNALKTRTIRVRIMLTDGARSNQQFDVQAADDAEFARAAHLFAEGVMSVVAMIREDEVADLKIGWVDEWNRTPVAFGGNVGAVH